MVEGNICPLAVAHDTIEELFKEIIQSRVEKLFDMDKLGNQTQLRFIINELYSGFGKHVEL